MQVNLKALPDPEFGVAEEYVAPSSELETQLQEAWTEVLGLPQPMSVTSDFFMAGGTSLQVGWGGGMRAPPNCLLATS